MSNSQIIENTKAFVKETLDGAEGGHDWFHIQRVYNNALLIAENEVSNLFIIELGALLHDIADYKFHNGNESLGPEIAKKFLHSQGVNEEAVTHVEQIIKNVSFKGGNTQQHFNSTELQIIQDADRLDALGAIGIARTFNYGGYKGRALYDPQIAPALNMSKEEYKNSTAPTINHFYEKLLLLKERMNTVTGRKLAEERHRYMEDFLIRFYSEWNGEK